MHVPPRIYRRVPFRTAVRLRFDRFRGFIEEYSANLSLGGMFIRTDSPPPMGTILPIEFRLGEDYELIKGTGRVVWVREEALDEENPAGMGIRFIELTPGSRELIFRMVERRVREGGVPFDVEQPADLLPGRPPEPGPAPEGEIAAGGAAEDAEDDDMPVLAPLAPSAPAGEAAAAEEPQPAAAAAAAPPEAEPEPEPEPEPDAEPAAPPVSPPAETAAPPRGERPPNLTPFRVEDEEEEAVASEAPKPSYFTLPGEEREAGEPEPEVAPEAAAAEEAAVEPAAPTPPPASPRTPPPAAADLFAEAESDVGTPPPRPTVSPSPYAATPYRPPSQAGSGVASDAAESPAWRRWVLFGVPLLAALAVGAWVLQDRFLADDAPPAEPPAASEGGQRADEVEPPAGDETAAGAEAGGRAAGLGLGDVVPGSEGDGEAAGEAEAPAETAAADEDDPFGPVAMPDGTPAGGSAGAVSEITWSAEGPRTVFLVWTGAPVSRRDVLDFRLDGGNPRHVVRILGIDQPYPRGELTVGTRQVRRLRTGLHTDRNPPELHLVFDLNGGVELTGIQATGNRLRIVVSGGRR